MNIGSDNETGRIEAFSDGVFAIAITLLIIEVSVPHAHGNEKLFEALVRQWSSYFGYALSFLQIGVIWANHHNRFRFIVRSDHILLFLNILFLMCVAFIPFPTAVLADYLRGSAEDTTTAGTLYTGTLFVTAVFFTLLWLYAAANQRLVSRDLEPGLLRAMTRRYVLGTVAYLVAFVLAFLSVTVSLALIIVLALLFVLPEPGGGTASRRNET